MAWAISSGWPMRFRGFDVAKRALPSAPPAKRSSMPVSIGPGAHAPETPKLDLVSRAEHGVKKHVCAGLQIIGLGVLGLVVGKPAGTMWKTSSAW
jgi:hypothetical protein